MRISMIGKTMCAVALSAALALFYLAPAAHAAPYDGSWTMVVQTTDGHCGVIKVGLAISGGHITSTSGKFVMRPIQVAGIVYGRRAGSALRAARPWRRMGAWTSVPLITTKAYNAE